MNEINAAQRKRVAAQELAEADRIKIVTALPKPKPKPKKTVFMVLVLPNNVKPSLMV